MTTTTATATATAMETDDDVVVVSVVILVLQSARPDPNLESASSLGHLQARSRRVLDVCNVPRYLASTAPTSMDVAAFAREVKPGHSIARPSRAGPHSVNPAGYPCGFDTRRKPARTRHLPAQMGPAGERVRVAPGTGPG